MSLQDTVRLVQEVPDMKIKPYLLFKPDDYEIALRRVMCVFLSIETLVVCYYVIAWFPYEDIRFYIHNMSFYEMMASHILLMAVPVILTVLSLFSRLVYYIIETVHVIIGILVFGFLFLIFRGIFWGIVIAFLVLFAFIGRIFCYCIFMLKKHK